MRLFILFFSGVFLFSCKKTEKAPTPPETVTLSIDSTQVVPGDPLIIKLNKKIILNEVVINMNSSVVKGYASGDSTYVCFVPVLAPGNVSLSIPAIKNSNNISLTVKIYTPITDPQAIINQYVSKRNMGIDSITKVVAGSNFQPSPQSLLIINQLKEEWDFQLNRLAPADKELFAYVLQKIMPDPANFSFTVSPAGYYAKETGVKSDVGDKLVAIAKVFVTTEIICLSTIPVIVASLYSLILVPNPFSALILAGAITTFIITREATIRKAEEVGRLKGVAEAITESFVQRVAANEFFNNTEKTINMTVSFRNLKTEDASIQSDIARAFNSEAELLKKDKEVEIMYNKAISYTEKLKAPYQPYANIIGKRSIATIALPIEGNSILIKSISDNRINYSTTLNGTDRKIKITSTATTEINFDLTVAYRRTLDGKEFTKTIACLYKPEFDSSSLYQANIVGNWKFEHTASGPYGSQLMETDYLSVKPDGVVMIHKKVLHDQKDQFGNIFPGSTEIYDPARLYNQTWIVSKSSLGYYYIYLNHIYPLTYPVTFMENKGDPSQLYNSVYIYTKGW